MDTERMVAAGDNAIFKVRSQTSEGDRRSLLMLQHLIASAFPGYAYLEVGSHVGGSIFPHLIDERCSAVISVDPRPAGQSDERGKEFFYGRGNTTKRMISALTEAGASTAKLRTFESDISAVDPHSVRGGVRLSLIDGEHTNRAAFRDFCRVLKIVEDDAIIAFHDSSILIDALVSIDPFLDFIERRHRVFVLPDAVFAVATGTMVEPAAALLGPVSRDLEEHYRAAKAWLNKTIGSNQNAAGWMQRKRASLKSLWRHGFRRAASSRRARG